MPFCQNCGKKIENNNISFCSSCGKSIKPTSTPSTVTSQKVATFNAEKCPICNNAVSGEKIISGGREYHRECYATTGKLSTPEPRVNKIVHDEICPICNKAVPAYSESRIVTGGKQYHRECYATTGNLAVPEPKVNNISHKEICSICNEEVYRSSDVMDLAKEPIISGGKQYHRGCLEKQGKLPKGEPKASLGNNYEETCPTCNKTVTEFQEKIIKVGKTYHRRCVFGSDLAGNITG